MTFTADVQSMARDVRQLLGDDVTVLYTPATGPAIAGVPCVFSEHYVDQADGSGTARKYTKVWISLADIAPNDPQADNPRLTIGGTSYKVSEARPDGKGGVTLYIRVTS